MPNEPKMTSLMRATQRAHGNKPIRQILVDALNAKGTVRGAAESIGITEKTCQSWIEAFGIEIRTVAA